MTKFLQVWQYYVTQLIKNSRGIQFLRNQTRKEKALFVNHETADK